VEDGPSVRRPGAAPARTGARRSVRSDRSAGRGPRPTGRRRARARGPGRASRCRRRGVARWSPQRGRSGPSARPPAGRASPSGSSRPARAVDQVVRERPAESAERPEGAQQERATTRQAPLHGTRGRLRRAGLGVQGTPPRRRGQDRFAAHEDSGVRRRSAPARSQGDGTDGRRLASSFVSAPGLAGEVVRANDEEDRGGPTDTHPLEHLVTRRSSYARAVATWKRRLESNHRRVGSQRPARVTPGTSRSGGVRTSHALQRWTGWIPYSDRISRSGVLRWWSKSAQGQRLRIRRQRHTTSGRVAAARTAVAIVSRHVICS